MRILMVLFACIALCIAANPTCADARSEILIKRAQELATRAKTLEGELSTYSGYLTSQDRKLSAPLSLSGSIRLIKPNRGQVKLQIAGGQVFRYMISDGKTLYEIQDPRQTYQTQSASSDGIEFLNVGGFPLGLFYSPLLPLGEPANRRCIGKETVNGRTYEVVDIHYVKDPFADRRKLYFGPDGILEGEEYWWKADGKPMLWKSWLKNVRLDAPLSTEAKPLAPPAGYTFWDPSTFGKSLLPLGSLAPDFELPRLEGGQESLAEARRGKKAVLINFWFYSCGPCRAEFPKFQKLYDRLKAKGLEMVTINSVDPAKTIRKFMTENKYTFTVLLGTQGMKFPLNLTYGVEACPTSYLVDTTGAVLWRTIGYDEPGLLKALEQAGLN